MYPAGTFRVVAAFNNVSTLRICNPFFEVAALGRLPTYLGDTRLLGVWVG